MPPIDKAPAQNAPSQADKPASTRDSIRAALDEHKAKLAKEQEDNKEDKAVDDKEDKVTEDAVLKVEDDEEDKDEKSKSDSQATDDKASKDEKKEDDKEESTVVDDDKSAADLDKQDKADKSAAEDKAPIPVGVPKEVRGEWKGIPSNARAYIAKTTKELSDTKAELGRNSSKYRDLDAVLTPYQQQMSAVGVTPAVVVRRLLETSDALAGANKYDAIQKLATSFGIDLTRFGKKQPSAAQDDQITDPQDNVSPIELPPEVQQEISDLRNGFTSLANAQKVQRDQAAKNEVNNWAGFDPVANTYKNKPYFSNVRQVMFNMMSAGVGMKSDGTVNLDEAYDAACAAVPEVRERIIEDRDNSRAERASADKKRKEDQKTAQLKKAKQAGSSFRPGAASMSSNGNGKQSDKKSVQNLSPRESIRQAIGELKQ